MSIRFLGQVKLYAALGFSPEMMQMSDHDLTRITQRLYLALKGGKGDYHVEMRRRLDAWGCLFFGTSWANIKQGWKGNLLSMIAAEYRKHNQEDLGVWSQAVFEKFFPTVRGYILSECGRWKELGVLTLVDELSLVNSRTIGKRKYTGRDIGGQLACSMGYELLSKSILACEAIPLTRKLVTSKVDSEPAEEETDEAV